MAFPDAAVLDNFNRADVGQPLSSAWTNGMATTNGHKVVSNTARGNATGDTFSSYWNATTFGPDCHCYLTVAAKQNNGNDIILYLRCVQPGSGTVDGYAMKMWQRTGADEFVFYVIADGSLTAIGSTLTQEVTAGDSIGFEIVGNELRAWYKPSAGAWTQLGTTTDSTYTAAGYIGFGNWQSSASAPTLDDFGGGVTVTAITAAVGQVTETDTAQPITKQKAKAVAQVTETDAAQPVGMAKARAIGQAAESDTAQAIAPHKAAAVGQVAESDLAQPVTRTGPQVVAIGQVVDTSSAGSITAHKTAAIGQVSESGAAQAIAPSKIRVLGQVSEVDTAGAVAWAPKHRTVAQVTETDTARAITAALVGSYAPPTLVIGRYP